MLHKPIETSSNMPWMASSTTSSSQSLHHTVPKSMRLASDPYYKAYAPFPGPTPYQSYPPPGPIYPHSCAAGWVQPAPQLDAAIGPTPGVYSVSYSYGAAQPPHSHGSSNGDSFHARRRAPSDSDHSSNYSQHHVPYQLSRNPSLTSIHERSSFHLESDKSKTQSREPTSTIPHYHPKANAPPNNPSKYDSKSAYPTRGLRIASLLSGRTTERPSIDWHVWDKTYCSSARDASGQFCATDMELDAFDPPVREPIFIKNVPGKSDGFSLAVHRWGPIRVSPRRPTSSITVNDIMSAISLWMMVPIQLEDWKHFDKIFEKHVTDAFEIRKMHAKLQRPLTGSARDRAQVVDSLFCRVRWDGMAISDDFAESKTVYLRLKDTSMRL